MKVSRLPKDPGPAGWNCLLPEASQAVELAGSETADWLIIGAGFAGLAAARRLSLARPGDRIVVLEATRIAEGPAGRNSGFMIDLPHDLASESYEGALDKDVAQTEDNRLAIAFAAEMAAAFELPKEAFRQSGKINAAAGERGHVHNRDYARHLSAMGEAHEWLDFTAMRNLTGAEYYEGGLFTPGAAIIQPAMFVRGAADGLRARGTTIYENSPVISLERRGDWMAETPKGTVSAPRVILAVNGHLNSFGFARGRLMHVFTYGSMTRALNPDEVARLGGQPDWGVLPADPMGTTVRRVSGIGGDRIVVRNRFTYDPAMEVDARRIESVARDHDRAFQVRFPMLAGVGMEYRWGGRLCLSRNDVQVVGELEDGLYSACCQNGLGTVKGTLAGMLAVDLALGVSSPTLERALAADAPKALPRVPFLSIAANARIRWGEWRAGREL